MQLYEGLPIITNKIPVDEQKGIPHHLLGCIGVHEPTWVVGSFVQRALAVIKDIHGRGKLPILVGGTTYYTQSLLFREKLIETDDEVNLNACDSAATTTTDADYVHLSTDELLDELRKVDPVMANRWHPNDRRKIQRSLDIYRRTGQKASEMYAAQRVAGSDVASAESTDRLRFPSLVLWVDTTQETLRERLDLRVDRMMQRGLLDEVLALYSQAQDTISSGANIDDSRGIWVSIGYKEFKDYCAMVNCEASDPSQLLKLKREAVERTKIATRQYAKRQVRWIRIKLVHAVIDAKAEDRMFVLDSTDPSRFEEQVVSPAIGLTDSFLRDSNLPAPSSIHPRADELLGPQRPHDLSARPDQWIRNHCEPCSVTCVTPESWEKHVKSRSHRRRVAKDAQAVASQEERIEHGNGWS